MNDFVGSVRQVVFANYGLEPTPLPRSGEAREHELWNALADSAMTWLTENPLPAAMVGLLVAGMLLSFWYMLRKTTLLVLGILAIAVTIGLVITERLIVTDREILHETVFELADRVRTNDVNGVLQHVSQTAKGNAYLRVKNEMPNYHFSECRIIGFREIVVKESPQPPRAVVDFVVWVRAARGTGRRRVMLAFEKEPDQKWRVVNYYHDEPHSLAWENVDLLNR